MCLLLVAVTGLVSRRAFGDENFGNPGYSALKGTAILLQTSWIVSVLLSRDPLSNLLLGMSKNVSALGRITAM